MQKKKSEMFRDSSAFTLPGDERVLYGDECHVYDHEPSSCALVDQHKKKEIFRLREEVICTVFRLTKTQTVN